MKIVTHEQLRNLAASGEPPCVSIFMTTHRPGRDVRQDPIELRHLLKEAEERLVAKGLRATIARDILKPANDLISDADFWVHNDQGLAIYLSKHSANIERLPIELAPMCCVNDRFEIRPLLHLLQSKLFYVLAISQNDVRFMECSEGSCKQLEFPEGTPKSVKEAVRYQNAEATTTVKHGHISASFHGQAPDNQTVEHENCLIFFRLIDRAVAHMIKGGDAPLVLAGADSTVPLYRQASGLRNIGSKSILGNPEHVDAAKLHAKALEIMQPIWNGEVAALQERFGAAAARSMASDKLSEILPAALQGRIETLMVSPIHDRWGKIDPKTGAVHLHESPSKDDEDLIDKLTFETLLTSGRIVVLNPDQMPNSKAVAAIYRY